MIEKLFRLRQNGTTTRTEILAGATTFMTMAYILAVNPNILSSAGMDRDAVFTATALSSFIAILIMAFYANLPIAVAPGMGLNAFFAYTVVTQMGYSWEMALTAVFIEGILFILLTFFRVREAIIDSIPMNLKYAISVGIGLFIALIGFSNAGVVVCRSPAATMPASTPASASSPLPMMVRRCRFHWSIARECGGTVQIPSYCMATVRTGIARKPTFKPIA